MVKAYVCKAAEWVTREAMQIHGGMGYAEEYDVSRYFVDARVLSIFEGADETLCLKVIARRMVEQRWRALDAHRAKDFFRPLAVGAPEPVREIPFRPSRVIHFFPASNPKMVAKVPDIAPTVDILLANLEDGVPATDKEAARAGLVEVGKAWTLRRHAALDPGQLARLAVGPRRPRRRGHRGRRQARRDHDPEGRGRRGHPLRRPARSPSSRPRPGSTAPLLVHAILETARGVANVEEICARLAPHAGPVASARPTSPPTAA